MKSRKKRYSSMFRRLSIAFILIGLLPLFILSGILFTNYEKNLEKVIISNADQQSYYVSKNMEDMIDDIDEITQYLYEYNTEKYTYFYQILKDDKLTYGQKSELIENALKSMMYMDKNIEGVRFIEPNRRLYCIYRNPSKSIKQYGKIMVADRLKNQDPAEYKRLHFIPTFPESKYYFPSERYIFTVARNYMDTSTIVSTNSQIMGTVYLDININKIITLLGDIKVGKNSSIYIIDKSTGAYIYSRKESDYGTTFDDLELVNSGSENSYFVKDSYYLVSKEITNTPWIVVTKIYDNDVNIFFKANLTYYSILLLSSSIFLIIIYLFSSRKFSKPVQELKSAMIRIEKGNLSVRVENKSRDEIGYLASGLNNMADNLQKFIDKVYIAELHQRDAELDALKNQIQPHFLYNTLDVIRMTALSNNDDQTAELLGSLSSQLQYLIGHNADMVPLRKELDHIREYFVIVKARYEDNFKLDIEVNKEDLELPVMKLLLQPMVENSIKYGFRNKRATGRVSIKVQRMKDYLEVTVMDDGVGISEDRLQEINQLLHSDDIGKKTEEGWSSIGIKNVYDRIKKNYGEEYGFEITSYENLGTIVRFKLPIIEETYRDIPPWEREINVEGNNSR